MVKELLIVGLDMIVFVLEWMFLEFVCYLYCMERLSVEIDGFFGINWLVDEDELIKLLYF